MKILAMENEVEGVTSEQFMPHLKSEAKRVWELYQDGTIREFYFREDRSKAILMLECAGASEARQMLESLPLGKAGLIIFDIIPLVPYPGIARLFENWIPIDWSLSAHLFKLSEGCRQLFCTGLSYSFNSHFTHCPVNLRVALQYCFQSQDRRFFIL